MFLIALAVFTTNVAEGTARNKVLSIYTATGATGFSLGLVFSGLLTQIGWRWVLADRRADRGGRHGGAPAAPERAVPGAPPGGGVGATGT